jgi:hypothetical protein
MTDPYNNIGWTAQSSYAFIHDEGTPGQTFSEDQLPHVEVQRASGINPELYRAAHGLTVTPAEAPIPTFVGTETGVAPQDAIKLNGNVESFVSTPTEVVEPVETTVEHVTSFSD